MKSARVGLVAALSLATVVLISCHQATAPRLTVYKTPTCGCCGKWVRHMRDAGFEVTTVDLNDLTAVKSKNGVPAEIAACHTAIVEGYVVEGHVPASDVLRLLAERPPVSGLVVPGMPVGSPGMEGPRPQRYDVYAFDSSGRTTRFAVHRP